MNVINTTPGTEDATMVLQETLSQHKEDFVANGQAADMADHFAHDSMAILKDIGFYHALVPADLGGGGVAYADMAAALTQLAHYHPSLALTSSMHQHIIAANCYNHLHGKPGQALLEKVVAGNLTLVSTGAGDWLASNGSMEKVDGGFLLNGMKHFASGSVAADMLVTSGPYEDPEEGWQVLHFPVPLSAEGVSVMDNWKPLGMNGTGSNSVRLENVFVPEASVSARRPRGDHHSMWCTIIPVALPLIMSVYRGVAESAAEKARAICVGSKEAVTPYILGEMENALTMVQLSVDSMVAMAEDYSFTADMDTLNEVVKRKTIAAEACKTVTAKALEACGGQGFMRSSGLEGLFRDAQASHFHPMQEKKQLLLTGSLAMGKEPPAQVF